MEKGELRLEVTKENMMQTIRYMTEHFSYRLAGSPCEAAAAEYVANCMKEYGLEVENETFYTYNSDPMYSKVRFFSRSIWRSTACPAPISVPPSRKERNLI